MIRVGLVTNWNDHCSIAEYAHNLVQHLPIDCGVDMKVIGHPLIFEHIYDAIRGVDVVHVNFLSFWMTELLLEQLGRVKEPGQKIVVTYQEPQGVDFENKERIDAIVVHDPKGDYPKKVRKFPNGIKLVPTVGVQWNRKLGSAGFASRYKRFDLVASAAKNLDLGCLLLMSQAVTGDPNAATKMAGDIKQIYSEAEVITDYLPYERVVRYLAESAIVVFPYDETANTKGIGNAVRFGLATGRPVVVSHHSHFRDLLDYQDEVYFIEDGLETTVMKVLGDIYTGKERLPKRLIEDMNWDHVAKMYAELYRDVVLQ